MSVSRVLVTGANGQLGTAIVGVFADLQLNACTHSSLDITNHAAVVRAVNAASPDVIVNCAAYNDVDSAESAPLEALAVNAIAVRSLARAAADTGALLVHYGTDFVFDGETSTPYDEDAKTSPQSTYAASKLLGEQFALEAPRAYVLRVESLFGSPRGWTGRRGTLDAIVSGLEEGREVRVFTDRIVSPSYVDDVAAATRHLLSSGAPYGLYHCVNEGHGSWHDVAREVAGLLNVTPRLQPATMAEASFKARRPRFCALSNRKLASAGFQMPSWRDALRRWLSVRGPVHAELPKFG
jgi:dTDP-4-dehydrorhamnose reductase